MLREFVGTWSLVRIQHAIDIDKQRRLVRHSGRWVARLTHCQSSRRPPRQRGQSSTTTLTLEARFKTLFGTLEICWYAQLDIPAFAYGAGRLNVSYGPAEWREET